MLSSIIRCYSLLFNASWCYSVLSSIIHCYSLFLLFFTATPAIPGTDIEQEGHDRSDMELPTNQTQMLVDVVKAGVLAFSQTRIRSL